MSSRHDAILQLFEPGGKERLLPMEGLRGFAVLLVFFVHFGGAVAAGGLGLDVEHAPLQDMHGVWNTLLAWLFLSHHGVFLFFILSGFLICRMVTARSSFDYPRFMRGRLLRIYPAFLISLILSVLWYALGRTHRGIEIENLLANLIFLNALPSLGYFGYNNVTWSLFMEFVFYLVFPVLLFFRPFGMFRKKWMMIAAAFTLVYGPRIFHYTYAPYLLFFAGAFAAQFTDQELRDFVAELPDGFVLASYLFVTTGHAMQWFDFHSFVLLFTVAGTLLVAKACYGDGLLRRAFEWAPLRFLGNVSYSFYLMHALVLSVVVAAFWAGELKVFAEKGQALLLLIVGFSCALLAAAILYLLCERPYFAGQKRFEGQTAKASLP